MKPILLFMDNLAVLERKKQYLLALLDMISQNPNVNQERIDEILDLLIEVSKEIENLKK